MATKAKYNRVKQEDKKEDKPDTDILMRVSPTYGIHFIIQVAMLEGGSLYSLGRTSSL
jgi:hypothetical protein